MLNFVIRSGLCNSTLWAVALAFLVTLVSWLRSRRRGSESGAPLAALRGLLNSPLFLAFVGLGTLFNFGIFGLYWGYVCPRDFMQDVISAQEFLRGRSLYPDNLTALFQAEMQEHPPQFSLVRQWPSLYEREAIARWTDASCHWAQAHPPLMTLYVALFVSWLGVFGTFFALNLISLAGVKR